MISRLAIAAALVATTADTETVKLTLLGVGDVCDLEEEDGRGGIRGDTTYEAGRKLTRRDI